MSNRCRIDVESMPNRPLRRGRRGGFEGESWGSVPNKSLTSLDEGAQAVPRERKPSCAGADWGRSCGGQVADCARDSLGGPLLMGSEDLLHPLLATFRNFIFRPPSQAVWLAS